MPGLSHFNLFNKDTRDLFMLYIMFMCQLYHALFYYCCSLFIIVVHLFCSLFDFRSLFCSTFVSFDSYAFHSFVVHCSKEKDSILILDCIPGILIPLYEKYLLYHCTRIPSPSSKSINIIHQTAPTLS